MGNATSRTARKPTINILLIGQTGAGKTTLFNYLSNVLKANPAEGFKTYHHAAKENKHGDKTKSQTQEATIYPFHFDNVTVNFIDTPGLGDTEGLKKDEENVKAIIDRLKEINTIDAVLFLINGTVQKLDAVLTYVFTEIKGIFPKSIESHIIVLLTNCDIFTTNFEKTSLGFMPRKFFHLQNAFAVWERMQSAAEEDKPEFLEVMKQHHEKARKTIKDLIELVQEMDNCPTNDFLKLYNLKCSLELELVAAVSLVQQIEAKTDAIEDIKLKLEQGASEAKLFADYKSVIRKSWDVQEDRSYYTTLCSLCTTNCHSHCGLPFSTDKEVFKGCSGIGGTTCATCGHPYNAHFHGYKEWVKKSKTEEVVDEQGKEKHERAKERIKENQSLADQLNQELADLRAQRTEAQVRVEKAIDDYSNLTFGGESMEAHLNAMINILKMRLRAEKNDKARQTLNDDIALLEEKKRMLAITLGKAKQ